MYTAVVLTPQSRQLLLQTYNLPEIATWEKIAHHMTINMKGAEHGPAAELLGQEAELTVTTMGFNNLVMAVGVQTEVPSLNAMKHITVAVNRAEGGKPFLSNKITEWQPVQHMTLKGVVQEVQ